MVSKILQNIISDKNLTYATLISAIMYAITTIGARKVFDIFEVEFIDLIKESEDQNEKN